MKLIVTGSTGHISKPLTQELVQKGHAVTVISSNPEKQSAIEAAGATAAIGSLEDTGFLAATFTGADGVYCMIPPNNYFDHTLDLPAYYRRIATNYARAIQESGVKRVVYLSSVGAHLEKDSGIILGHHEGEGILKKLADVGITFMRPVGFYYNLYGFVPMIKNQGVIAANWGAEQPLVWVSPIDIAAAVAEELQTPLVGQTVRYVVSDERTGHETAGILGAAIGKPDLNWVIITSEQMQGGLVAAGLNPQIAAGLTEMYASQQNGALTADYYRNKPAVMGNVKLEDFAQEFAAAFDKQ